MTYDASKYRIPTTIEQSSYGGYRVQHGRRIIGDCIPSFELAVVLAAAAQTRPVSQAARRFHRLAEGACCRARLFNRPCAEHDALSEFVAMMTAIRAEYDARTEAQSIEDQVRLKPMRDADIEAILAPLKAQNRTQGRKD